MKLNFKKFKSFYYSSKPNTGHIELGIASESVAAEETTQVEVTEEPLNFTSFDYNVMSKRVQALFQSQIEKKKHEQQARHTEEHCQAYQTNKGRTRH